MIWANCLFFFWHVLCNDNQQTTATHFSMNKRLHLESSEQNYHISYFWAIIKAIFTSREKNIVEYKTPPYTHIHRTNADMISGTIIDYALTSKYSHNHIRLYQVVANTNEKVTGHNRTGAGDHDLTLVRIVIPRGGGLDIDTTRPHIPKKQSKHEWTQLSRQKTDKIRVEPRKGNQI